VSVVLEPFKENIIIAPVRSGRSNDEKVFLTAAGAGGGALLASGIFFLMSFLKKKKAAKQGEGQDGKEPPAGS
jgi:hypothetical protein